MHRILYLLVLVSAVAAADLVIELTDGRRIVVPVDKTEVVSIEFTASSASGLQDSKIEHGPTTVATAGAQSSDSQIWRVGPGHALKHPSSAAKKAQKRRYR